MRQRYDAVFTGAGQVWPDIANGVNVPPFNWVLIENRDASNPVDVALARPTDDKQSYLFRVPAGHVRVKNIAGPENRADDLWAQELYILSVTGGSNVHIEVSDKPIVDFDFTI